MEKKRPIDANELIQRLDVIREMFRDPMQGFTYLSPEDEARVCELTNCIAEVINSPTMDYEEVLHGKWEQVQKWSTKAKYRCSICGREIMSSINVNIEKYPYCHCGAKME